MVRHKHDQYPVEELIRQGWLDLYQAYQKRPVFDDLDVVVSLYGLSGTRACLYGVFAVDGRRPAHEGPVPPNCPWAAHWHDDCQHFYDLKRLPGYEPLERRVVAKFHRKFTDANRPAEIGYEHPTAKAVYDAYHETLGRYCRQVQKSFRRGLLLDLHGQGTASDTIFRGTKDGKTVTLLVQRYGDKAQDGPQSFFGLLAAEGCKVHPRDGGKERAGFTGGYIVQTYGSHQGAGIDAIQLEFGGDYRAADRRKETAAKVANAVAAFAKLHLSDKPVGDQP